MKFIRIAALLLCAAALLCACSFGKADSHSYSSNAMGSPFEVAASGAEVGEAEFDEMCREAALRVKDVERMCDAGDAASEVSRFNGSDQGVDDATYLFCVLVSSALYACELTDGAYDPTMGAVTDLWKRSRASNAPTDVRVEVELSHCGQEMIGVSDALITKIDEKLMLDLDPVKSGFAVSRALVCFDNSALEAGSVTIGDSVGYFGGADESFVYAVRDHLGVGIASANVGRGYISRTVAAAGENSVPTVIDPSTGKPSESDVKCAIVKSGSGVMSAAISFALTVLSSKRALETWKNSPYSFDAILVIDDGTVYALGAFAADGALDFTSGDYHLIRIKDK